MPWAATTTLGPSPSATCSEPPATGTSKVEYGSSTILPELATAAGKAVA